MNYNVSCVNIVKNPNFKFNNYITVTNASSSLLLKQFLGEFSWSLNCHTGLQSHFYSFIGTWVELWEARLINKKKKYYRQYKLCVSLATSI